MPQNRVIIPFTLKAHLANNTYADTYKPPRWYPDYTKIYNSALGASITPPPFTEYESCLKAGVHLHFILPAAFRHGAVTEKGYAFPTVPNRYVITRMYEKGEKIRVKCFVVESDFIRDRLGEDESAEDYSVIPYLKELQKADAAPRPYRFIGRWYEADKAPAEGAYLDEELTVIAGGDPMFAAYYPTCRSVFGWYDALEDVPDECALTYFVLGYYGCESKDPFFGVKTREDFNRVLTSFNFTVDGDEFCDGCVFFGEALNIEWKGKDYPYPDMNPPDGETNASFGYTSADAMSAVLAKEFDSPISKMSKMSKEDFEYNLTKLQYDLLKQQEQEDGNFKIDDEIHKRTFRETDPLEEYDELSLKEKNDGAPPNLEAYYELRRLQRETGRAERRLSFTRKKLYYMWETYIRRREAHSTDADEALREVNRLIERLSDDGELMKERNRLKEETERMRGEVKDKLPPEYELKTVTAAPFVIPKEPVLMLSGNGIKPEYVFDGRTSDGSLRCHFLPPPLNEPGVEEVLKKCVGLPSAAFPLDYSSLLYRAVINSPRLLKIFTSASPEENPLSDAVNETPLELSQLFMDWQVRFDCAEDEASLQNWDFDFGSTDYTFRGKETKRQVYVNGRIPLTPHAHKVLTDRLNAYGEKFGEDLREKLHDLPFISQELSGFTNELTGLRQVFQLPVGYDARDISKKVEKLVEKHRLSVCGTELFPLRGGYLSLSKLNIISTFGQKQMLVQNGIYNKAKAVFPYYMTDPKSDERGLLTLAFTSEARLTAEFTSARLTDDCSPICAFILPELINKRLILYDEKGEYAGMLKTVIRDKKSFNIYLPSGSEPNQILKGFIDGITQNAEALPSLIALMEDKLNKTVRTCQSDFIWGVPLALAQLRVSLEFFGGAEYSKTDKDFGLYDDKGTEKLEIPLKFGNIDRVSDGTVGVYDGGVFSEIHALWGVNKNICGSYVKEESRRVSAEDGDRIFTVLTVPDSDLNIETGLLPALKTRISSMYTSAAEKIIPAAEINPILADSDKIRLPISDGFKWRYKASPEGDEVVSEVFPIENIISEGFITDGFIIQSKGKKEKSEGEN